MNKSVNIVKNKKNVKNVIILLMMLLIGVINTKYVKCSDYSKACNKIHEECYLEYIKVVNSCFLFKCLGIIRNKTYHLMIIYQAFQLLFQGPRHDIKSGHAKNS